MADRHSRYHQLCGKWVSVSLANRTYPGKLESDTFDSLVLRPALICENTPIFSKKGELKYFPVYRIEKVEPLIIDAMAVQCVEPERQEFLEELVKITTENLDRQKKLNSAPSTKS